MFIPDIWQTVIDLCFMLASLAKPKAQIQPSPFHLACPFKLAGALNHVLFHELITLHNHELIIYRISFNIP